MLALLVRLPQASPPWLSALWPPFLAIAIVVVVARYMSPPSSPLSTRLPKPSYRQHALSVAVVIVIVIIERLVALAVVSIRITSLAALRSISVAIIARILGRTQLTSIACSTTKLNMLAAIFSTLSIAIIAIITITHTQR